MEPRQRKRLSRMDCDHRRRMFLSGQHGIGDGISYRHEVTLCPDCGEFNVFGYKNGERFDIQFTLNTDEAVAAAGVYLEMLREDEQSDDDRLTRQDDDDLLDNLADWNDEPGEPDI